MILHLGNVVFVLLALHAAPIPVVWVGKEEEDDDPYYDDAWDKTESNNEADGSARNPS